MKNAATLRKSIEIAAKRPTAARLAKAIAAVSKCQHLTVQQRQELTSELQRNAEMLAECGCVSWDGLDDCLQIAIAVERESLVIEIVGKPEANDETRTRNFVARLKGAEIRGEVFRGWDRINGLGWSVETRNPDGSLGVSVLSSHRTIDAAIRVAFQRVQATAARTPVEPV